MLFPLHRDTPASRIFIELNRELLHFLETSIESEDFNPLLFTAVIGESCWGNEKTREKFQLLWEELQGLSTEQRRSIFNQINERQNVQVFFEDRTANLPSLPTAAIIEKIKVLTKHLFSATTKLAMIRRECGESLENHFDEYCRLNHRLCQACGTELLAQPRAGLVRTNQWRAAYDHLLSKDKHPAYGIHPYNLFPLCFTCNSKAKGTKELLNKKVNSQLIRRLSFYPPEESCMNYVTAELVDHGTSLSLSINWNVQDTDTQEKIEAWDEVYQVKSRVEGIDADIILKINDDCDQPIDLDDFKSQLARKARRPNDRALRSEPMKFWRYKLYDWLSNESDDLIETIWEMIEQRRDDENYREEYGI